MIAPPESTNRLHELVKPEVGVSDKGAVECLPGTGLGNSGFHIQTQYCNTN